MARASDGDQADAAGPDLGSGGAGDVHHRRHALVGRLPDLRRRRRLRRRAADPRRTASCSWTTWASRRSSSRSTSTSRASPGTSGSASRSCTRSSCASTTRSATTCTRSTRELDDQDLYEKARLVNAALMAKIHTVDWTPAVIAHPTTVLALACELVGPRGRTARQAARQADVERRAARDSRIGDQPPRRAVLADRGVRRGLPDAPADPGRLQPALDRGRPRAPERDAARPRRAQGARDALRAVDDRPPLLVRDDVIRARSRSTTSRSSSSISTGRTGRWSTSPRSTSCARASGGFRATTSSGGSSISSPVETFEEMTDNPEWAERAAARSTGTSSAST